MTPHCRRKRGAANIAARLLFFLLLLVSLRCATSMNLAATQGHSDLQPAVTLTRSGAPSGIVTQTLPVCQQSRGLPLTPENRPEDLHRSNVADETGITQAEVRKPGTSHLPIGVSSDSDFANQAIAEGWPGNGTAVNPYIIERLDISTFNMPCIAIWRTTVHFCIRHCSLQANFSGWPYVIILDNVSNGCLLNNTCTGGHSGIRIFSSTNITAADNRCSHNTYDGILVSDSSLVTLFNNTCSDNSHFDIELYYSRQNEVVNNTCSSPMGNIALVGSGDNTLANNSMTGGGLLLSGYSPFEGRQTLVTGNTVNAKPLLFWQDQIGGTLPIGFGQAILVNCSQTTVRDATVADCYVGITLCCCNATTVCNMYLSDNVYGLVLYDCHGSDVFNNAFFYNGYVGISIQNYSSDNLVRDNTCIANYCGIDLTGSGNTLLNNTCLDGSQGICVVAGTSNSIYGSWITDNSIGMLFSPEASYNFVERNIFIANELDAQDMSNYGNYFNYNYWQTYHGPDWEGNGMGDTPYHVPGTAGARDSYPLMLLPGSPVTWLEVPTDQYFPYGSYIRLDLNATATPPGLNQWWLGDTTLFTIDQYGVLTNGFWLALGDYWVQVWVSDWVGNVITANFSIIVYGGTSTVTMLQIPIIIGIVAAISTVAFVSIVAVVVLRQRRATSLPPMEPFGDKRPPVDQWNARCPLCGSHLFGDEGFCPGCGNQVTKSRGG